ncbi:MAG: hypothetical protein ACOX1P_28900 [Thermoguttaceae bacterium]
MEKSTVDEIRQRFDADVERFSNLETGQSATIDAPLREVGFARVDVLHKNSCFAAFGAIKD